MRVRVEIADTPWKLAKGLMHRQMLPQDAGMLFVFGRNMVLSFWGENTFIPLDIAFINRDRKIEKIGTIESLSKKAVSSDIPCVMAIEVNAGFFASHGIKPGDSVRIEEDRFDGTVIHFEKIAGEGVKTAEKKMGTSITEIVTAWTRQRKPKDYSGQMGLPFGEPDRPIDEDQSPIQSPPEAQGDSGMLGETPLSDDPDNQDESLPQVSIDQIPFADDDENDYSDQSDQNAGLDSEGNPLEPSDETPQEPEEETPDAEQMDNYSAIDEAIQNSRVMWIQYNTTMKKPKIGPWMGNKMIMRIVEPHGVFHAKTTGNNILVVYDETAREIRAFVIDRIRDKAFTGQTFQKKFVVTH